MQLTTKPMLRGTRTIKTSVAKTANENVITYAAPKAINAVAEKESISVYPNPVSANRQVTLKLQSAGKNTYDVTILNHLGQQVKMQTVEHGGGNSLYIFDTGKMAVGVYTIEVKNKNTRFVKTLLVELKLYETFNTGLFTLMHSLKNSKEKFY